MNKSTKIRLNYVVGGIISALLLWGIYVQVQHQLAIVGKAPVWQTGPSFYFWICIILMPVNVFLETAKWHILASSAYPLSFKDSLLSYLAGISFSIVTPNRIGEYPGRILYLERKNTFRLISVSILGALSQLLALFIFGLMGLLYYNVHFPDLYGRGVLIAFIICLVFLSICYWQFDRWLPLLERFTWVQKLNIYGRMLKRFTAKQQLTVIGISLLRFSVFTAQYLFLLRWMHVEVPFVGGYCMAALFFGVIGVFPTIALTELGVRGNVAAFLFQHYSDNTVGILGATAGLWCLNLIIPAAIGSLLFLRIRIIR